MASEQMKAIAAMIRANRDSAPLDASLAERREGMEVMQGGLPLPEDLHLEDVTVGGRPAQWVRVTGAREDRTILYLHGGGYVMGSLNTHRELMARLSRSTQARVLGLDYRLAPEDPFPAAVDDAEAAYRWLLEQGAPAAAILIAGDSAGGGLAVATLLRVRDAALPLPAGAVLFSPWTDLTASGESIQTRADTDPMIAPDGIRETAALYHGASDPRDPFVSPLFADLTGLPPLLVQAGDDEILLDDATRLAANAARDGVSAELQIWPGAFHVFQAIPSLPEASEALERVGEFARAQLGI